ncbi:hypothetical protein HYH03_000971 [Edaphochlamys debaryana]|uniref:Uncharacterized protein n=1 Tax=Edaphochlamys debaryana TaxID=47281 RepID=A0A835YHP8_9CHLO|nr:hypothetical protein HYH03_000971 [Edaphochlamys debaryana]|eukprot:KAG2501156.1 hypothetical protein HYH03_000971 [Edaphochlamys debaryana]
MDLDAPSTSGRPADPGTVPKRGWALNRASEKLDAWLLANGRQKPLANAAVQAGGGAAAAGGGAGPSARAQALAASAPAPALAQPAARPGTAGSPRPGAAGAGSGGGSYSKGLRWYARPPSAGPASAKRRQELEGNGPRDAPGAAGGVPMLEGAAVAAAAPLSPDRGQEREEEAGPDAPAPLPPVRNPGPEGAPFSELLVALDRAGRDLASRAGAAGPWGRWWLTMVEGAMRQLRAAVDVLLLAAAELPSRADWRAEGERNRIACEVAVDLLLCEEPFANFDECDPDARLPLVEGILSLTRLAAARSRRDPDWRPTLDACHTRLLQWLLAQHRTARQLAAAVEKPAVLMELRRTKQQAGGLPLLNSTAPAHLQPVARAHEAALAKIVVRLEKLLRAPVGRGLAERLLDADANPQPALQLLQEDMAPPLTTTPAPPPLNPAAVPCCLVLKLRLMQRAVLALANQGEGLEVPPPGQEPQAGQSTLSRRLAKCKINLAIERVVKWAAAGAQLDPLLTSRGWTQDHQEATEEALCFLGTVYGTQYAEGDSEWADVEMAVARLCLVQSTKAAVLSTVWQANGANPRQRGLVLSLLAQVVRNLAALERRRPLVEALLPRASRDELLMQPGLLTTWFHAALDLANRVALADLTQELLLCPEVRPFLLGSDTTTPAELVAAAVRADSDGSVCAQLTWQLFSSLVAERRSMELGEMLKDAVLNWRGLQPSPDFAAAGPNRPSLRIEDLARSMLAHRAMAAVALAALEPCGKGRLAEHATRAPGWSGGFEAAQAPLRLLECVAEAMARDAAALVKWDGAPGAGVDPQAHLRRWCVRLAEESSVGLLPELVGVLAPSADAFADHDTTPSAKATSVLQRCLSLVCLMVCDLPPTAPAHAETRRRPADASGGAAMPLQPPSCDDNLVGCVHRCLTGTLREHVKAGLNADHRPDNPLVRRTTNALAWLELLMGQEAVRERSTLERLLPPLLHLVVNALVEARQLLLRRGALLLDVEEAPQPQQPQPQRQLQPQHASTSAPSLDSQATQLAGQLQLRPQHAQHGAQHAQQQRRWGPAAVQAQQQRPPYALIRQVLSTVAAVLAAAGGTGLLAPLGEAETTPPVSVALNADPMHLLRPADRHQLRAAAGLATGLLLRLCAECAAATLPLDSQGPALEPLRPAKPHEHGLALRQRLGPCLGVLRAVPEWEKPHKAREGGITAGLEWAKDEGADGADGALKTGGAALRVLLDMVQTQTTAPAPGLEWARPAGASVQAAKSAADAAHLWTTELEDLASDVLRQQQQQRRAGPPPEGQGEAEPREPGQGERSLQQPQQRPGPPLQGQGEAQEGRQQPAVPGAPPPPRDRRLDAPGPEPRAAPDRQRPPVEEPKGQGAKRARAESPPALLPSAAPPGQQQDAPATAGEAAEIASAAVAARAPLPTQALGHAEEPAAAVSASGVAPSLAELEVSPAVAAKPRPRPPRLRLGLFMRVPGSDPQDEDEGQGAAPSADVGLQGPGLGPQGPGVGPQGPGLGPQGPDEAALSQGARPALGAMDRGPGPQAAEAAAAPCVAGGEGAPCQDAGAPVLGEEGEGGVEGGGRGEEGRDEGEEEEGFFVPATPEEEGEGVEQAGGGKWGPA